jgi:hypothetical protein
MMPGSPADERISDREPRYRLACWSADLSRRMSATSDNRDQAPPLASIVMQVTKLAASLARKSTTAPSIWPSGSRHHFASPASPTRMPTRAFDPFRTEMSLVGDSHKIGPLSLSCGGSLCHAALQHDTKLSRKSRKLASPANGSDDGGRPHCGTATGFSV